MALKCRLGLEGGSLHGWGPGSPVRGAEYSQCPFYVQVVWTTYLCRLVPVASPERVWLLDVPAVALHARWVAVVTGVADVPAVALHARSVRRVVVVPAVALHACLGGPDLCAPSLAPLVPPGWRRCVVLLVVVPSVRVGGVDHLTHLVVPRGGAC